jgi:uncharacterized protein (TIGR02246 family)
MMTLQTAVQDEIAALEERLRQAELGPDPDFFQAILADDVVLMQNGDASLTKKNVIDGHQRGHGPKFTHVELRDMRIVDHGDAAVVTCAGTFTPPDGKAATLKFMRVWLKTGERWQIVAGSIAH